MVFLTTLLKNGQVTNFRSMKRFISVLILSLLSFVPAFASYTDVASNHQYIQGITYVELQGASDHAEEFRPDEIISRGEAFKLLFEVLQVEAPKPEVSHFDDAPIDAWFTPYAELALENDLISDRHPEFNPDKSLRRFDAIRLMMQSYGLSTPVIAEENRILLFEDVATSSAAYPWLYQLVQVDILEANAELSFSPYTPITRGEFADWLYQFDSWLQNFKLEEYASENNDFHKSDILESVWNNILNNHYLEENQYIDEDVLFQAAIKGMVESLNDPYSVYFTPEEANNFTESISGEFEGIGAILDQNELGQVLITGVIEGGPAAEAGIQKNDIIRAIDGINIEGMDIEEVVERIKGPVGTNVLISIVREEVTMLFELTRAHIEIILQSGNVKWGDTWAIDIDTFSSNMFGDLMDVIFELEEQIEEPDAIVLDLRGNLGGSLQSANFTLGLFLPHLTPLVQLDYGDFNEIIYNGDVGPYQEYPIFVLIDGNSASASEIVALTLQENGATIIGHQSYGKGTAQQYLNYWDGSSLKLTVAEWLSGEGQSIQGFGVTPDVILDDDATDADWWAAVKQRL